MAHLTIRKATADDAQELSGLLNETSKPAARLPWRLPFPPTSWPTGSLPARFALTCHVAQAGSGLAGFQFLSLYENRPEGWADIGPSLAGVRNTGRRHRAFFSNSFRGERTQYRLHQRNHSRR